MMELKNMKISAEESKEQMEPSPAKDLPKYPYGLQLNLRDEILDKLGINNLPDVGSGIIVIARAEVSSVNVTKNEDGKRRDLSLQITDMAMEPEKKKVEASEVLYGKK